MVEQIKDKLLQCGVAVRDISPDEPELLEPTGMKRLVPTRGNLDNLRVESLALRCGDDLAFVVTSDLRTWPTDWVAEVQRRVAESTGCDPTRVLLGAVHNHCSSPIAWGGADAPEEGRRAEEAANRKIVEMTIEACLAAASSLRPAELATGVARLSEPIGQCRRMMLSNGTCVNAWGSGPIVPPGLKLIEPPGTDPQEIYILCVREVGAAEPMAVLTEYDCHPHLGAIPYFSGESVGEYKRQLEAALPGVLSLHAAATGGDRDLHGVHPITGGTVEAEVGWFKRAAKELGARFARAVGPAVRSLTDWHRPGEIRSEYYREGELDGEAGRKLILTTLSLGPRVAIVSMPGEFFGNFGRQIHEESPFEFTFLSGYNGSMLGYVPYPLAFEQGSYEVMRGPSEAADAAVATARGTVVRASDHLGPQVTERVVTMLRGVAG